jgi:carbamoyltransferase
MKFCGIKVTHDGAVAVIDDGGLVLSCESEKVGNRPRYSRFDDLADIEDLLGGFGYSLGEMDVVAFDGWHRPYKRRRWRGIEVELRLGPYVEGITSTSLVAPIEGRVLDLDYLTFPHYASHVAAAYCTSPFAATGEPALILSWDGLMYPCLYQCHGDITKLQPVGALFPLVGNAYPVLAGAFPPFDDRPPGIENLGLAGKVMAYAALGTPRPAAVAKIAAAIRRSHAESRAPSPFAGDHGFQLEAGVTRLRELAPTLRVDGVSPCDMIASIDSYMRDRLVGGLRRTVPALTGAPRNLCLTGGTALNINWNRAIRDTGLFDSVWVPPFPNDSGAAIGVACCAMAVAEGRSCLEWDVYRGPSLGAEAAAPGWSRSACSVQRLARLLHETGEPVVFLTGRAELGPRALGHRSILAPATDSGMHDRLNEMKEREPYRPIAPVCLEESAPEIFDPGTPDPYMLFNHRVRDEWRERVPAICHVDGTARLQTVNKSQCPEIVLLLQKYRDLSGVPLLCNTSANFKNRGFFPDAASAMRWGKTRYVWSEGVLFERSESFLGDG